jgi:hypothetical protein
MSIRYFNTAIVSITTCVLIVVGCSPLHAPAAEATTADHAVATFVKFAARPTTMSVSEIAGELAPDCAVIDCIDRDRVVGRVPISQTWSAFVLGEAMTRSTRAPVVRLYLEFKSSDRSPPSDAERRITAAANLWRMTYVQDTDPVAAVMTMMRGDLIYPGIGANDLERVFAAGGTSYGAWTSFEVSRLGVAARTNLLVEVTLSPSQTDWPSGRCTGLQIWLIRP